MANKFQIKRTSVTGRTPEVSDTQLSSYIDQGELAINTTDKILYSSDGTNLIEIGSNNTNVSVSDTLTVASQFIANSTTTQLGVDLDLNGNDLKNGSGVISFPTNITGSVPLISSTPSDGQILEYNNSTGLFDPATPSTGATSYSVKTADYTASTGDLLVADTSGGSFTITLPASPSAGDFVVISDGDDFSNNNLTIGRNSQTIEGIADDVLVDFKDVELKFVYNGTTWNVTSSQVGVSTGGGSGSSNVESIDDLSDVTITSVADNELLQYNSGTGQWINQTITEAGFAIVATSGSYNDLSNQPSIPAKMNDLSDVTIDSVTDNELLQYNLATDQWINQSFAELGLITTTDLEDITANTIITNTLTIQENVIEEVFTITGTDVDLDPTNGAIQFWTLTAASSANTDPFNNGESIILQIDDGSNNAIDWANNVTWVNNGGSAPTLTDYTVMTLWKASNTVYGALIGDGT